MAGKSKKRSRKTRSKRRHLHKPNGVIAPRVAAVGPQNFALVCIDPAKRRSRWMMTNFLGEILIEPQDLEHDAGRLRNAIACVKLAKKEHGIQDMIVVVERTGRYHESAERAFSSEGFETRIIHPFATKQFRQVQNPGNKTDDTDLVAMHHAAVTGFGLSELPLEETPRRLRLLVRHRRDLVEKRSALCCQIKEYLHRTMPGYADCFDNIWKHNAALPVARFTGTPQAVLEAGGEKISQHLSEQNIRFQSRTIEKILAWARQAAEPALDAELLTRIWSELLEDREAKSTQIAAAERDSAELLVQTPYARLLIIPGIHVVSAADLAGEMGPISHYANANAITGRAGIFPSRYQSDETDHADGPMVRCANRRLRATMLRVADNLVKNNHYYIGLAEIWRAKQTDERLIRVRAAKKFSRLLYVMVAGDQPITHECCTTRREFIMKKIMDFHREHATPIAQTMADLHAVVDQLPRRSRLHESEFLSEHLETLARRRKGPTPLGELLPAVLARLSDSRLQSEDSSGDAVPNESSGR